MAFHPLFNTNMSPNFKKKQIVSMQVIVFGVLWIVVFERV